MLIRKIYRHTYVYVKYKLMYVSRIIWRSSAVGNDQGPVVLTLYLKAPYADGSSPADSRISAPIRRIFSAGRFSTVNNNI